MRNFHFIIGLILLYLVTPVVAQTSLQKIFLHPKAPGTEKQSKFIDSIRFIPLEIQDGVELTNNNRVEVTKNYYWIADFMSKRIFFYSRDGKFIKNLSYKKLGEGLYPTYNEQLDQLVFFGDNKNYSLTSNDRLKILRDWDNPRNRKYFKKFIVDLSDTTFTIKKQEPTENDISRSYPLFADIFAQGQIKTSELYTDSLDYEFKLYRNKKLIKGFFPYNHINEPRYLFTEEFISLNRTDDPFVHVLSRPYCDTIYKLNYDSICPAFQIVLPLENSLPASFFNKPFKNRTERDNFKRNNGWMFRQAYNIFETSRFIYFSVSYLSNFESYIYQKQTNTTSRIKNIRPDSTHYNLQLLGEYGLSRKGGWLYKAQKAGELLAYFSQNKNARVPKELENFLKINPPAATPVIVEYKFKD